MSRKVSSSAPSASYRRANSTGSPASRRFSKLTPLTTRPASTSRQGMTRTATVMLLPPVRLRALGTPACSLVAPSLVPRSVAPQSAGRGARFGSRGDRREGFFQGKGARVEVLADDGAFHPEVG